MNDQLIRDIYQNEVQETDWLRDATLRSERQVTITLSKLAIDEKMQEEVKGWLYDILSTAEEGGFIAGFRYAVNLMSCCMEYKNEE